VGTVDWVLLSGAGLLGLVALGLSGWALFADRSRGRRRCPRCWFDMTGLGMRCPECGREAKRENRFFRTRRRWRVVAFAALPLLIGAATALHVRAMRATNGWWVNVPTTALIYIVDDNSSLNALNELAERVYEREGKVDAQLAGYQHLFAFWAPDRRSTLPLWQQRLLARRCAAQLVEHAGFGALAGRGKSPSATPPSYDVFCVRSLQCFLDPEATRGVGFDLACSERTELMVFGCEVAARAFLRGGLWSAIDLPTPMELPTGLGLDNAAVRESAARILLDQFQHPGGLSHTSVGVRQNSTPYADIRALGEYRVWLDGIESAVDTLLASIDDPDPGAEHAVVMAAWEARGRLDEMIERIALLEEHEDQRIVRVARRVAERAREIRKRLDDLPYE